MLYILKEIKNFTEKLKKGAIVTEYFLGVEPYKYNFPQRNRIISGLSLGVIIVEAKEKVVPL